MRESASHHVWIDWVRTFANGRNLKILAIKAQKMSKFPGFALRGGLLTLLSEGCGWVVWQEFGVALTGRNRLVAGSALAEL